MKKLIVLLGIVSLVLVTPNIVSADGCDDDCGGGGSPSNVNVRNNNTNKVKSNSKSRSNSKSKSNAFVKNSGNSSSRSAIKNSGNSSSKSFAKGGKATVKNSGNSRNNINVKNNVNASSRNKLNNSTRVKTGDVDASSRNKLKNEQDQSQRQSANNKQRQSANNEGVTVSTPVNVGGDHYESTYIEAVQTTPLVGTTSMGFTTAVGGGSVSIDAAYAKIKMKMDQTEVAFQRGYITDEERKEEGRKLYKQLLKANKKGLISNIVDPLF